MAWTQSGHEYPVVLADIDLPIFSVGTRNDHVAPRRSVYKTNPLAETEVTFVLTSDGRNAGIVSERAHPNRKYQIATSGNADFYLNAESWKAQTPEWEGLWWPAWTGWLRDRSTKQVSPPSWELLNTFAVSSPAPPARMCASPRTF